MNTPFHKHVSIKNASVVFSEFRVNNANNISLYTFFCNATAVEVKLYIEGASKKYKHLLRPNLVAFINSGKSHRAYCTLPELLEKEIKPRVILRNNVKSV